MNRDLPKNRASEDQNGPDDVAASSSRVRLLAQIPLIGGIRPQETTQSMDSATWPHVDHRIDAPHLASDEPEDEAASDEGSAEEYVTAEAPSDEGSAHEWKFEAADPALLETDLPLDPAAALALIEHDPASGAPAPSGQQCRDRQWRVDAPANRGSQGRNSSGSRRQVPPRGQVADRLFDLHTAMAPHAGFIVTMALVFSAGLLYWLTIGPARVRYKPEQTTPSSDIWQSEASSSNPLSKLTPEQRLAISTYPYGRPGRRTSEWLCGGRPIRGVGERRIARRARSRRPSFSDRANERGDANRRSQRFAGCSQRRQCLAAEQCRQVCDGAASVAAASPYPVTPYPPRNLVAAGFTTTQTTRK